MCALPPVLTFCALSAGRFVERQPPCIAFHEPSYNQPFHSISEPAVALRRGTLREVKGGSEARSNMLEDGITSPATTPDWVAATKIEHKE